MNQIGLERPRFGSRFVAIFVLGKILGHRDQLPADVVPGLQYRLRRAWRWLGWGLFCVLGPYRHGGTKSGQQDSREPLPVLHGVSPIRLSPSGRKAAV